MPRSARPRRTTTLERDVRPGPRATPPCRRRVRGRPPRGRLRRAPGSRTDRSPLSLRSRTPSSEYLLKPTHGFTYGNRADAARQVLQQVPDGLTLELCPPCGFGALHGGVDPAGRPVLGGTGARRT